jgi:hypothetical protein
MLLVTDASRFDDQGCRRFELQHNTSHACSNLLKNPQFLLQKVQISKRYPGAPPRLFTLPVTYQMVRYGKLLPVARWSCGERVMHHG